MRTVAAVATLCVLAGCTALLYVRGERETFIHVALPEAIVATTRALLEGQHGEEPLHAGGGEARSQGLGAKAAEAKDENEATPVHYARPTEALEAGPAPSKVDGEGATSLVEALNAGVASPSEAKDWATPLVAASSTLTAPACPLAAAASNSTPKHHLLSAAPAPTSHVASRTQWFIIAGPNTMLDYMFLPPSAGSTPTDALPPQLPQILSLRF